MLRKLIDAIVRFVKKLLGRDEGKARLKPVSNLEAIVMAKNVLLKWSNPTQRTDNTPATPADIGEIYIRARLKALPDVEPVLVATVSAPAEVAAAERLLQNVGGGTWVFFVSGVDKDGQPFDKIAECEVEVPKAPLRGVTDLRGEIVE